MYLPLEYVKRYSVLTELYCSEEYINCEPEVLLESKRKIASTLTFLGGSFAATNI